MTCTSATPMCATTVAKSEAVQPGAATFHLLNGYQRGFPLVSEPFATIGVECGLSEQAVLAALQDWLHSGIVSRVGAVFAPRRVGASALAALAAPASRLESIAARISAVPEVNHNYQREHSLNLWFVITAASEQRLRRIVAEIEQDTGCTVVVLPLEEEFHIDLGFDLGGVVRNAARVATSELPAMGETACALPGIERRLMAALQSGLPLQRRPFEALGQGVGLSEAMVIEMIASWLENGLVKRFGIVVRHHELGFCANAMCVWDIPDEQVSELGRRLAAEHAVTLCYRRSRVLPHWPYNLFCMIHGKSREAVLEVREAIAARHHMDCWPHAVLFSSRRFKQQGARYLAEGDA